MTLLFETTLEAYIERGSVMLVVVREQADPEALPEYEKRVAAFIEQAKDEGFVRNDVDSDMVPGLFLDRILNQVQFAPWIKRNYGTDVSDAAYRQQWSRSNLDIILNGIVP
jgi:hypothetical protein